MNLSEAQTQQATYISSVELAAAAGVAGTVVLALKLRGLNAVLVGLVVTGALYGAMRTMRQRVAIALLEEQKLKQLPRESDGLEVGQRTFLVGDGDNQIEVEMFDNMPIMSMMYGVPPTD